jgi:DNA-binding MarR family transcriptional regulator
MRPPVEELVDETRLLWHVLTRVAETLHQEEDVTLGMRGVLEHLAEAGPAPVPGIARAREVSRQHIQGLVNGLLARGLVTLAPNPAHQRSPLVTLSSEGRKRIGRMRRRERRLYAGLDLGDAASVAEAAGTLRRVRRALGEGP